MHERLVLSQSLQELRKAIEDALLEATELVTFVSVGFSATDADVVVVSVGTTRTDLLLVLSEDIVVRVMLALQRHDRNRAWNPEIRILRGRTRG